MEELFFIEVYITACYTHWKFKEQIHISRSQWSFLHDVLCFTATEPSMGNNQTWCLYNAWSISDTLVLTGADKHWANQCWWLHRPKTGIQPFIFFWHSIFLCSFIFFLVWSKVSIFVVAQRGHGSQSVAMVQVTTMAVDSNLLVVGGFQGELICKVFLLRKYSPTLWSV